MDPLQHFVHLASIAMNIGNFLGELVYRNFKKEEPPNGFPVLKLPSLVLDEFLKLLDPSERYKFALLSKQAYFLCKQKRTLPKHPNQILGFYYPPLLTLRFERGRYISFIFKKKAIWQVEGTCVHHSVGTKAICIFNKQEEVTIEQYTVYCDNLIDEQMKIKKGTMKLRLKMLATIAR